MGRSLTITVVSARDLRNADAEEGGESDPFVIVCFDNKTDQELGRTETASDTSNPEWDHTFEVDVTSHIEKTIEDTGKEPQMLTFCVYDGDEGSSEPLGVAGLSFSQLVKKGKVEDELPVFMGNGFVSVKVSMKKVKIGSMLKDDAAVKIAGGVAGAAALGVLGTYLYKRYQKKKEKIAEKEEEDIPRTGIAYGANIEDDDDDEEDRDTMRKWWEMDDEDEEDDEQNRWTTVDESGEEIVNRFE